VKKPARFETNPTINPFKKANVFFFIVSDKIETYIASKKSGDFLTILKP
jgi:hypothetical protein